MTGTAARYDQIADFYDATAGGSVVDPATAALLRLAGQVSGMRLVDVACGQGRVTRELAHRGAQVTGLDISAALLAKARSREQAEPPPGPKWERRLPGAAPVPLYLAGRCRRGSA